ncbi:MAG: hypothetical protein AAF090_07225 [Bacteroidota bacterium]
MKNKPENLNSKKFFGILFLNHFIFILIMLGFGAFHFIFWPIEFENIAALDINHQTSYGILSVFIAFIFLSHVIFSKTMKRLKTLDKNAYVIQKKISGKNLLILKMGNFRTALITRLSFVLLPIILSPMIFDIRATYFLCLAANVVYALVMLPTKKSVIQNMKLDESEIERINNPQAIIAKRTFSFGVGNAQQWRY